ncbi:MAG: type 1 glutamine amidotransferase [Paracoccus sp. (in: a-proteobacteria)]|nr:type 1 glutamine amidotransferase [Paracoccus sp. (in: a-proteobacteria)]
MHIGILQCGQAPDALKDIGGDYPDMFRALLDGRGFTFSTYHVEGGEFPEGPDAADGWLITGSRHGAYEDHDWIPPLENFIRTAFDQAVPMVGVCFGHQIIAQALGGKVEKFDGGWAVGPTLYDFGDEEVTLNAWHQDQVVALPEGAEIAGRNDFCEYAALIYDDRAYSVQAHPEFDNAFIEGLIEHRGGSIPDDLIADAREKMHRDPDSARFARKFEAFFKQPRPLKRKTEGAA